MAVFGKIDSRLITDPVTATQNSTAVTGVGFKTVGTDNYINAGDIIEIEPTRTPYVVAEVVSDGELRLSKAFVEATVTGPSHRRTPPKQVASYVLAPIDTVNREILLISADEAALVENKEKGLCSPGWWLWDTYTTAAGDTRYKANHIASISALGAASIIGDDDTDGGVAADVASVIAITAQPAISGAATEDDGVDLTVSATATTDQGTLSFQWQRQKTSNGRWVNITASTDGGVYTNFAGTGVASATPVVLTIGAALWADDSSDPGVAVAANGYEYRVKFNNSVGGEEVVSTTDAVLSVTPL